MKTTTIMQSLKTAILATIIGLGVAYALAWVGPTQAPPLANVPGPINKGSADQIIPNNISLKGKTGTELFNFKSLGATVDGLFETHSSTYLATKGGRVGIGTANPTALLDVGSDATYEYQYQSTDAGLLSPRCDCDTNSSTQDCPTSFLTTDAAGSVCYDRDTSSLNLSHKYLSIETAPAKHALTVDTGGNVINNNFKLAGGAADLLMRRAGDGDTTWKRALVAFPDKLYLNYSNDFSGGVETQGKMTVNGWLVTSGGVEVNGWLLANDGMMVSGNMTVSGTIRKNAYTPGHQPILWSEGNTNFGGSTTYLDAKEFKLTRSGAVRVAFALANDSSAGTVYGRIFVNDVPVGTERFTGTAARFVEVISGIKAGDLLQIKGKARNSSTAGHISDAIIMIDALGGESVTRE